MSDKVAAKEIFSNVQVILVDYLNYIASDKNGLFNEQLDCILSKMNLDTITNIISIIEEELRKLEYNVNYKLWLDGLFARLIGG